MYSDLFAKNDAILVMSGSNRRYFSDFDCSFGCVILTPEKKFLLTDFRYAAAAREKTEGIEVVSTAPDRLYDDVRRILASAKAKNVGFEDEYVSVAANKILKKELADYTLRALGPELSSLRIVKTEEEIAKIRRAQEITETALTKTLSLLKAGVSEKDMSAELAYQFMTLGDGLAFDSIVAFGENSADCHHVAGDRKLERGDIVLFDIGAKYRGYCADMTRTFCFGEPSQKLSDLYLLVLSAQQYVLKHLKAGVTGREADSMAREFFKANGYDSEFGHSLGHGVGIDIHEEPRLSASCDMPLHENAVVTIETGLYIEGFGGVRIEDLVVVKKDDIENLTNYDKSLII